MNERKETRKKEMIGRKNKRSRKSGRKEVGKQELTYEEWNEEKRENNRNFKKGKSAVTIAKIKKR